MINVGIRKCFIIMPFSNNFKYFYYFIKHHLKEKYDIVLERADAKIMPMAFIDKIKTYIKNDDLIIADLTQNRPNVLYELGIAHQAGKDVILISSDSIDDAPSDIKHFDIIRHDPADENRFLSDLDTAIDYLLIGRFELYYDKAVEIFRNFVRETGAECEEASKENFIKAIESPFREDMIPPIDAGKDMKQSLLPLIVKNPDDDLRRTMNAWIFL